MSKKCMVILLIINLFLCIPLISEEKREPETISREYADIAGYCPVIDVWSVEKEEGVCISDEEKMLLCKIVEAEAGCEDRTGKILVANVIINRMEDERFPNTIESVIYQEREGVPQFSPVADGRLTNAVPDDETIEAVEAALMGEDYSQGALYFMARKYADAENVKWFERALDKVLTYGGHEFYK